ncbi:Ephrin type-B receptor 2 [Bulinus truncatus]|nr:Ephrin type-B receptor 2 [Bulinus truncatus]
MEATVNKDGDTLRTYSSCYVRTSYVDNWLRLPYIERGDASSLHINITFTMRKCSKIIDSTNLQQCKETFNLYYFEAGSDFANSLRPSWDALTYKRVGKIAADKLFVDSTEREYNEESRQISLTPNGPRGVYFAIQDEGGCVTLVRVKVYYLTCPNVTRNFAFFPETPTGERDFSVVPQKGTCVDYATQKTDLSYLCRNDGMWYDVPKGECVCNPGYQGNKEGTQCAACPAGTYKWSEGSGPCEDCPPTATPLVDQQSVLVNSSITEVREIPSLNHVLMGQCLKDGSSNLDRTNLLDPLGSLEGINANLYMYCFVIAIVYIPTNVDEPPSAPRNPIIESQSSTSVTLSWDPPADLGDRQDLFYRIVCQKCSNDVLYMPGWKGFNTTSTVLSPYHHRVINVPSSPHYDTITFVLLYHNSTINNSSLYYRVTLSNLEGGKTYEVIIYSENGVTNVSATTPQSVSVNIVTQSLGKVMNLRKLSMGPKFLTIGWDIPLSMKSRVLQYQIRYYPRSDESGAIMKYSQTQNFTLTEFMLQTEYIFMCVGVYMYNAITCQCLGVSMYNAITCQCLGVSMYNAITCQCLGVSMYYVITSMFGCLPVQSVSTGVNVWVSPCTVCIYKSQCLVVSMYSLY